MISYCFSAAKFFFFPISLYPHILPVTHVQRNYSIKQQRTFCINAFHFDTPHRFVQILISYFVCGFYFTFCLYFMYFGFSSFLCSFILFMYFCWKSLHTHRLAEKYCIWLLSTNAFLLMMLHIMQMHWKSSSRNGNWSVFYSFFPEDHFRFVSRIWIIISKEKRETHLAEELMLKEWYGTFTIRDWEFDIMSTLGKDFQ